MIRILLAAACLSAALPAPAESLAKTYSYFSVGGTTLDEIEEQLNRRGPQVKSTGRRHPGATQMQFTTRLGYAEQGELLPHHRGDRHGQGEGHPAALAPARARPSRTCA